MALTENRVSNQVGIKVTWPDAYVCPRSCHEHPSSDY